MARGGAARTGFVSEQADPPLTKIWESDGHGPIISGPVIYGGGVYAGSHDKRIYAFDENTGSLLWQYQTGGWVDASPAVSGNSLYVVSRDGYLYAFDRRSGAIGWKAALGASSISSPLILGGRIWVGTGSPSNNLMVFDAATGNLLAALPAGQPVNSPPSTDGINVYFGANNGKLYAININTLSVAWSYQTMGGRYGTTAAAVSGGIVYALPGFDENKPLALDAATGLVLNQQTAPFDTATSWEQVGSPVVSADSLYFPGGASGIKLYALQAAPTSQALTYEWASPPSLESVSPIGVLSAPSMAGNTLYAGTVDGALVAYSSAGVQFTPLTSVPADVVFSSPVYSSPGISNGIIVVGGADGRLAAYKAAKIASFSSPSPGDVVAGIVTVKGYFANPALAGYKLEYSSGTPGAVWYTIVSSVTAAPASAASLGSWNTAGLPNGLYTLRLNVLENSDPNAQNIALLTVRADAAPAAASGLTAADVPADSGNKIKLAWRASPAPELTAYRIYRAPQGQGLVLYDSVVSSFLTYVDSAAVTGSTFTYSVRAFDGYSESPDSNLVAAYSVNNSKDQTPPSTVADLAAAQGPAGGSVSLTWTAPGNDGTLGQAAGYVIKYTSAPGYNWGNFDSDSGLMVTTRAAEGPYGSPEQEDIQGLFGGVTYYFALKADDFVPNFSQLSNVATAWATIDNVPPRPPSGLAAADTPGDAGGSITMSWGLSPDDAGGAGDVYGYKIYRRLQGGAYVSTAPYALVGRGVKTYIDAAAPENIRFYYSVAAFDSSHNSDLSNESSAVSANNYRFFDASRGVTVKMASGMMVNVPENAASQNDNILVTQLNPDTYQPLFRASGLLPGNPTGLVYAVSFENPATRLIHPATIILPYSESDVVGMNEENLRIYSLSGDKWAMVNTSQPDTAAKTVTAAVMRFSTFALMEYVPSGVLFNSDEVYTYPNPAKGSTLTFKFKLADKSFVKIDVYNIAGQRVARLEKADCPSGEASEIVWGIGRIASGVYQYRLEADSASGTKFVIKRLAIVH
jgi:outer membrane protein assembly factor BamB